MSWLAAFRPPPVPSAISAAFGPDEHLLALTPLLPGGTAAATRRGLYLLASGESAAQRIPWHLVSRARLDAGTLSVTVADQVGVLPSGVVLLRDRPPIDVRPERRNKLTDVVHARVRGSVIASDHLVVDGVTGGWLALRSVAGQDGLVVQFRFDPGSSLGASAAGVDEVIAAATQRLLVAAGRVPIDEDPEFGI